MLKNFALAAALVLLPILVSAQDQKPINKVTSIDHVVINVIDIEKALAFYKRLGFTLNNEDGWRKGQGQVSIQIGDGQKLNIHKQNVMTEGRYEDTGSDDRFSLAKAPVAGGADFCLVWGGTVAEAEQLLKQAGIQATKVRSVIAGRGRATSVYFRDLDGNLWELTVYGQ